MDRVEVVAVGHNGKTEGEVVGYYGHKRRRVGEKFTISRADFPRGAEGDRKFESAVSGKWMEPLSEKEAKMADEERQDIQADARRRRRTEPVI